MSEPTVGPNPAAAMEHLAELLHLGRQGMPGWVGAQDLTFGQLRLLFRLHRGGPATMSQVAGWLDVTMPTATGIVQRIERHGLACRRHRDDDRRVVEACLTEQGRELMAEVDGTRLDFVRTALGALGPADLAEFDRLLGLMIEEARRRRP